MKLWEFDCSTWVLNEIYRNWPLIVRNSTIDDMIFVDKLQKENSYAVWFIQKTVWEKYVYWGERNFIVLICEYNHDPVGYVLITPWMGVNKYAKIQQIAIRNDARRLQYGTALINTCRIFCEKFWRVWFTLRCRIDLDANHFWKKLWFEVYDTWEKWKINHVGFNASDDINMWKIELNNQIQSIYWFII